MRSYRPFVSMTASVFAALLSLSTLGQARPMSPDEAERTVALKSIKVNAKLLPLPQELITLFTFENSDLNEFRARQHLTHNFLTELGFQQAWSDQSYDVNYVAWYSAERDTTLVCATSYGRTAQHLVYSLSGKMTRQDYIAQ